MDSIDVSNINFNSVQGELSSVVAFTATLHNGANLTVTVSLREKRTIDYCMFELLRYVHSQILH